nr:TolC family protein [Pedobacter sp. ASV2]
MNFTRYKRVFWMCISLLLSSIFSYAQSEVKEITTLNINQVWQLADSNSKKIKMQQLDVQTAEAKVKVAKAERLPEVEADAVLAHIFEMPIYENGLFHTPSQYPVEPKYYKISADAYLNLYNGGKTNREIEASKTELQISKEKQGAQTQEIHYTAAVYFYDVYRNQSYKKLLEQDIKEREKQLLEIGHMFKNGAVLKSDVLRAELRLSKQKMLLTEIENSISIATQKLNLLIGKEEQTVINPVVSDGDEKDFLKGMAEYMDRANSNSFQVKISEKEQQLAELRLKQVKSNILPSLGLFGEYAFAYPQIQFYPYSLSLYSNGMAGLKLKIPISSFYNNKNKVRAATLQLKKQHVEDEDVKERIKQEVQEYYLRYTESLKRIDVAQENIKQASESYRIVQNTYFNHLSLLTDLLDAETQLLQSRFELTTARVNAKIQYYQLQKVVGTL